jgi:hypothetical protein
MVPETPDFGDYYSRLAISGLSVNCELRLVHNL